MAQKRLADQQRNRVEEKQRRGVAAKKGSSAAEQQRSRAEHKKRRREIMQRSAPTFRERGRAAEKRGQQRRRSQGGTRERWKLGTLRVVNPFQVECGPRCRGLLMDPRTQVMKKHCFKCVTSNKAHVLAKQLRLSIGILFRDEVPDFSNWIAKLLIQKVWVEPRSMEKAFAWAVFAGDDRLLRSCRDEL